MKIAKIVGSNSHIAYFARVLDARDGDAVPGSDDFGFGTFVSMEFDNETAVGVICDSRLLNPELANVTSSMGSSPALSEVRREHKDERKMLIGILLLGSFAGDAANQNVPRRVVPPGQIVETMPDDGVRKFHSAADGSMRMNYLPNLMSQAGPLANALVNEIISQLMPHCDEADTQRLNVMAASLAWKHTFSETRF